MGAKLSKCDIGMKHATKENKGVAKQPCNQISQKAKNGIRGS